jgi:hypothetical protein
MSARNASLAVQPSEAATPAHSAGTCRLCGAGLKHTLVDLGKSPLCETFLTEKQID